MKKKPILNSVQTVAENKIKMPSFAQVVELKQRNFLNTIPVSFAKLANDTIDKRVFFITISI
jgi:hypothetical protein